MTIESPSALGANCNLTMLSGTLAGSGDISIAGTFNWSAGTMIGSGKMTLPNGATLNLNGGTHQLNRVLENNGTANWTAGALQRIF